MGGFIPLQRQGIAGKGGKPEDLIFMMLIVVLGLMMHGGGFSKPVGCVLVEDEP